MGRERLIICDIIVSLGRDVCSDKRTYNYMHYLVVKSKTIDIPLLLNFRTVDHGFVYTYNGTAGITELCLIFRASTSS